MISFLDSQGQKFVTVRYAWDWRSNFLDLLAQLLFERPLPDCDLSTWVPVHVLRRCPPMQILISDQPADHKTRAYRYITVLLSPLSLVVFEYLGPLEPVRMTSMKTLELRWKELDRRKCREHCLAHLTSMCPWG